jgi:hypothetical protein
MSYFTELFALASIAHERITAEKQNQQPLKSVSPEVIMRTLHSFSCAITAPMLVATALTCIINLQYLKNGIGKEGLEKTKNRFAKLYYIFTDGLESNVKSSLSRNGINIILSQTAREEELSSTMIKEKQLGEKMLPAKGLMLQTGLASFAGITSALVTSPFTANNVFQKMNPAFGKLKFIEQIQASKSAFWVRALDSQLNAIAFMTLAPYLKSLLQQHCFLSDFTADTAGSALAGGIAGLLTTPTYNLARGVMSQTKAIRTVEDKVIFEMNSTYKILKDEYLRGKRKFFSGAVANVCKGSLALPLIILADKGLDFVIFKHLFPMMEANQTKQPLLEVTPEDTMRSETKEKTEKSSQLLSQISGLFSVKPLSTQEADYLQHTLYTTHFDF